MLSMFDEKPILVTGSHRSATTFVGRMLTLERNLGYIHEPFNIEWGIRGIDREFLYLDDSISQRYQRTLDDFFLGKSKFKPGTTVYPKLHYKYWAKRFWGSGSYIEYRKCFLSNNRMLVKDPIACFSSEFLVKKYRMKCVCMMRHPAAFVASLVSLGWDPDISVVFCQDELVEEFGFEELRSMANGTTIERAACFWLMIYRALVVYVSRNEDMFFVRHEDLSVQPIDQFRLLYSRLGLAWSAEIEEQVIASTSDTSKARHSAHDVSRDSVRNLKKWRACLSSADLIVIRRITESVSDKFYSDDEW